MYTQSAFLGFTYLLWTTGLIHRVSIVLCVGSIASDLCLRAWPTLQADKDNW